MTIGISIIFGIISATIFSIQPNLGFLILIPIILLNFFIFVIAHGNNPRIISKFTFFSAKTADKITREYIHYVRPLTSNKWVKFDIWADIMRNSSSSTQYQLKIINPFTWKLPLIGAIIILISLLSPAYIISSGTDLHVYWFLSFYYSNSFTFIYLDLSTFFLNFFYYFIILVGILITVKQSYILKRANTSLKGSVRIILIIGILILLITILQISITAQIIGPALYGLLIGSILMILGPVNQYYRNKYK